MPIIIRNYAMLRLQVCHLLLRLKSTLFLNENRIDLVMRWKCKNRQWFKKKLSLFLH